MTGRDGSATTEIGNFIVRVRRDNADEAPSLWAAHVDPVTAISPRMLNDALQDRLQGMRVVGDRLMCEFANGSWTFHIGEYRGDIRAIVLRLTHGEPLN